MEAIEGAFGADVDYAMRQKIYGSNPDEKRYRGNMNYSDAAQLREKWGDKPCDHPEIEAEVEAGHPSNNYVCTTCGKVGEGNKWNMPTERKDSN